MQLSDRRTKILCDNLQLFSKSILFLTLFNKVEKCNAFGLSVCPSVHALTVVNILQMSWNLSMLFISDTAWSMLKMIDIRLIVHLQKHTKLFRYISAYWGGRGGGNSKL